MPSNLQEATGIWKVPAISGEGSVGSIAFLPAYEGGCHMKGPNIHLSMGQMIDFLDAMKDLKRGPVQKLIMATVEDELPATFTIRMAKEEEVDSSFFNVRIGEDDPPTEKVVHMEFSDERTARAGFGLLEDALTFAIAAKAWMRMVVS
ncbi:hypothetical protein C4544_02610 [candidate division WS5 bacterium]|uniref:Uncharacterized protein n=1 Tax=candidate division WS5 bacterium TaxID=2093353 RepID=A0A419DE09_9BACT|nr:MAG: hypothetical protein C4544_02610 [candidate division WS5 bacterium]